MQAPGWEGQGRNAPGYWGALTRERVGFGTDRPDLSRRFISRPLRPPLPQGEGWGEGTRCKHPAGKGREGMPRVIGAPSPGLRPPSPKGRGVGFGTDRPDLSRRFISRPLRPPLPQGEGWGEGTRCKHPAGKGREGMPRVIGAPSPGLRPPSPKGRGVGFGTDRPDLSRRFISRPLRPPLPQGEGWGEGTRCKHPAGKGREGMPRVIGAPSPDLRPPSPRGRGV